MKQKQQPNNKHSGSARARSDQWTMDIQNRLKSTLEGKINRIETFIESANEETDSVEIKVKLRSLIQLQKKVEELRNNYYAIPNVKDAELTAVDEDLHLLEVRLESLEVRIETILNSSKKSSSGAVMKTNDNFEIKTKIPPLVLPEFSGKYEEFSSFKIQFDDLITNNILLSESQKLYYLRSCLTHEVNYLCSNFDNFNSLYEFLENRYENERLIINIHIQNILKLEKIQNENFTEIRNMIDCVQKNLRALKVLKYEQNKLSDVLLINILVEKLDRESRRNFELSHKSKTVPTFQEFIEFLEQRESVLLSVSVDRNAKVNPNKIKSYNELSDNYPLAKQRFQNLWRRFGHDSELYQQYREIIRDYTEQGHKKDGRLTSKTRIVFDAGSHQNNELSLNDCLWPGINLNPNLLDILINFRLNAIAFCSDIKQAFLQICLADEHKDAVRFLWSDDEPCVHKRPKLQVYRFNRVNFGVSSSPFLLAATIRHHIEKYKHEFPDTVELLDRNFYVDDLISGGNEFEEALQTSRRAKNIMEAAGMDLRKWITNDANLMEQWKKENFNVHPVHETVSLGANGTKVLGLSWNTNEDYLTTDTKSLLEFVSLDKNTKRFILQAVGKIFDPLGLISPFTVRMKCLLQDLWKEEIQWDDPLPTHIEKEWKNGSCIAFATPAKKTYGAAIYLRTKSRNGISVKLVTSKSRVAPLNCVTLNRLELLGALVAARLASKVKKIVNLKRSCLQYHWTDSKIILFGIKGNKTRWKQFVANRVNEITSLTDPHSWYHCAGKENPTDFLSRGLSADCLVSNSRWWTGAEFLSDSEFPKNFQQVVPELDYLTEHEKETVVQERKKLPEADRSEETVLLNSDSSSILDELLELSNNYFKVINILSYIFRFNYNCRNKSKKVGPLTVAEFKESEIKLIKHAQRSLFDKKEIPSSISNLFPFVDGEGIVRVGGRLENASVPYLHKHPAILPKGSKLSKLYFNSLHTRLFHVGPQGLLNAVRQKFWPLSGRSIPRKTVHQCVTCFKSRPILSSQIMGNLPSERVNISSPFTIAGLDLCGPFLVKYKNQRKGTLNKVYICVCICFSTKVIHLELLSDLTSDALIATLKRFTSRRGKCSKIYTDNATNFVGANSILKKFHKLINFPDENLAKYFVSENIDWKFIPPKSPHFGGLWEAGVKSVKHHLKRAIGNLHFTFEEFETIMIQVEGILNSRPLTHLSSDADNFDVLTPGHFLIGRPITSIPEPNLIDVNENRLSRWEKITKVVQRTWKKWKSDFLNTLQARSK
ncbi:integrase catalytic domain-containing protein [Trichonephila clavipes]|nr:integrase catalytic domain-containing protein [Trichonephila clavipes]